MRRTYAVVASAEAVYHIKMSRGYRASWGLRLARSFISAFWWYGPFRREALPRLLTPARTTGPRAPPPGGRRADDGADAGADPLERLRRSPCPVRA